MDLTTNEHECHGERDTAMIAVSDYLHRCGVRHPITLCERSRLLVDRAEQILWHNVAPPVTLTDTRNLSSVSLQLAIGEIEAHPMNTDGCTVRPTPEARHQPMGKTSTPRLAGPLRWDWWVDSAARIISRPEWVTPVQSRVHSK